MDMDVLKVSTKSSPNAVAGAIAGIMREGRPVCLQVIGAGALNQAVKALAIARAFVAEEGFDPICYPEFADVDIAGETRTAIRLLVTNRAASVTPLPIADPALPADEQVGSTLRAAL